MCGFIGFLGPGASSQELLTALRHGDLAQAHRGPDGRGEWIDPRGSFAVIHRLLAIRDPAHAAQPHVGHDRSTILAYNGEVYNAKELAGPLAAQGHRFAGRGDTEVLSAHLERYGAEGLERVEGMFALALYDPVLRDLVLAVDPQGEKPLYVAEGVYGGVLFASEIRALLATDLVGRTLDPDALALYLAFGSVPSPQTLLRGIRKIPPGSWIRFALGGGEIARGKTDPLPPESPSAPEPREDFASGVHAVTEAISSSVRRQLVSDRPVAVLLSGGIDSALVASFAAESLDHAITTITMAFEGSPLDESADAARVAAQIGSRHLVIAFRPEPAAFLASLEAVMDEPIADGAVYALHDLCRAAADHAVVLLSGDGGDEYFLGYDQWRVDWSLRARRLATVVQGSARVLARVWPKGLRGAARWTRLAAPEWLRARRLAAPSLSMSTRAWLLPVTIDPAPVVDRLVAAFPASADMNRARSLRATRKFAIEHTLASRYLVKSDRASMAAGTELRSPLLDVRVRRAALARPVTSLVDARQGKRILRAIASKRIAGPHAALPKRGLRPPYAEWIRGGLRESVEAELCSASSPLAGIVDSGGVRRLVDAHARGPGHFHQEILTLWILAIWMRRHKIGSMQ